MQYDWGPYQKGVEDTDIRGGGHVTTKAMTGEWLPQAKGHVGLLGAGSCKEGSSYRDLERRRPC